MSRGAARPPRRAGARSGLELLVAGRRRQLGALSLTSFVAGLAEAGFLVLITRTAIAITANDTAFDVGGRRRWVFPSVTEAARAVGTSRADNISDAIGRGGRCAGLLWGYCDAVPAALKGITADADAGVLRAFLEDARPPRRAGTRPRGRAGAFQNSA